MSKAFIVLGMHRSATSLSAAGLKKAGVNIGKQLLPGIRGNPKGHFENIEFIYLNDKILKAAGGDWYIPPKEKDILALADSFKDEIQKIINRNKSELWGWKDPRTTLTIRLYLPYLENPHFIVNFREPLKVAKSLRKRDGFPIGFGLNLAREYNKRLLSFLNDFSGKVS